jgi:hypothetical protein
MGSSDKCWHSSLSTPSSPQWDDREVGLGLPLQLHPILSYTSPLARRIIPFFFFLFFGGRRENSLGRGGGGEMYA